MIKWPRSNATRYSRDVWLLCLANTLGYAAFLGVRDLLSPLYWLRLGFGADIVGTLFATGALSFCLASLPGGALGTRFGARRTMIAGVIVGFVGQALLPFTGSLPPEWRVPWLVLSQVVSTAGWSLFAVNIIAALAASVPPAHRQGAYAMSEVGAGLGMFAGSLGGSMLPGVFAGALGLSADRPDPYAYALWAAVALCVAMLVPLILVSPPPAAARNAAGRTPLRLGLPLLLLVAAGLSNQAAFAACKAFSSAYMDAELHMSTPLVGAVTSLAMAASIAASLNATRLARKRGSTQILLLAAIGISLCLLLLSVSAHPIVVAVGITGALGLVGLWRPVFQSLQMEIAHPEWRSLMSGITSMGMSLGFGSMSFGGGRIVALAGYRWLFLAGAAIALLGVPIYRALRRHEAPHGAGGSPESAATAPAPQIE